MLRASVVTSATATKDAPVVVAGATTSTGRLVASLAVKKYGGANVVLVVNKDAQKTYWPEDMPEDVVEQRMFAPADELVKCVLVDPREAADALGKCSSVIFCAEWGATQAELATALTPLLGSNCGRAVMLSRVGINRRDKAPFETQNKPPKKMQEMALGLKLPFGENSGQPGTLDGFADAEGVLAAAQANSKWTAHVVRSGELRGNGPLLLADLSARLVDNLYDVKYQDLYFRKGDDGQGYTKRLNLAATLLHTTTTSKYFPFTTFRRLIAHTRLTLSFIYLSDARAGRSRAFRGVRDGRPVRVARGEDRHRTDGGGAEERVRHGKRKSARADRGRTHRRTHRRAVMKTQMTCDDRVYFFA